MTKFAVDNCIWKDDMPITKLKKQTNFKGWALLADSEQAPVAFLDQTIEVLGKRSRKQVVVEKN